MLTQSPGETVSSERDGNRLATLFPSIVNPTCEHAQFRSD